MSRSQIYDGAAWVDMTGVPYADTWLDALFTRPSDETVHADDQEFTGTIGGTAVTPTGTATWTQGKHRLSAKFNDQTVNDIAVRLYSLTPVVAPVTIEAAVSARGAFYSFSMVGVVLTDGTGTSANAGAALYYPDVTPVYNVDAYHGTLTALSTNEGHVSGVGATDFMYLRLIWSASNTFQATASPDGVTWVDLSTGTWADTLTPTYFGVMVSTWGGATESFGSFEYLRVTESDLS